MAKQFEQITPEIRSWLAEQHLFFVATAPLAAQGLVNCSPKGIDSLRILGPREVGYLHLTGTGVYHVAGSAGFREVQDQFVGERDTLIRWAETKGDAALQTHWATQNACSIDGLPGIA